MNSQLVKEIRRYVDLKMKDEQIPERHRKPLYKTFKKTYEMADPTMKEQYRKDMQERIAAEAN